MVTSQESCSKNGRHHHLVLEPYLTGPLPSATQWGSPDPVRWVEVSPFINEDLVVWRG